MLQINPRDRPDKEIFPQRRYYISLLSCRPGISLQHFENITWERPFRLLPLLHYQLRGT